MTFPTTPHLKNPETLSANLKNAHNFPKFSESEEYELVESWRSQQDSKSLDTLIMKHKALVENIARRYRGYGLPLEDLVAEGYLGILQAVKGFDPQKGFRFGTYARWWIKSSIQSYIMGSWSLVKIGTTSAQKKLFFSLRRLKNQLQNRKQAALDDLDLQEISDITNVSLKEIKAMEGRLQGRDDSLNFKISSFEGEDIEWQDLLQDDSEMYDVTLIHTQELNKRHKWLLQSMACLNEREQKVLVHRRLKEPPKKLDELATTLGLTKQRIHQIEINAFEKLRKEVIKMAKEMLSPPPSHQGKYASLLYFFTPLLNKFSLFLSPFLNTIFRIQKIKAGNHSGKN